MNVSARRLAVASEKVLPSLRSHHFGGLASDLDCQNHQNSGRIAGCIGKRANRRSEITRTPRKSGSPATARSPGVLFPDCQPTGYVASGEEVERTVAEIFCAMLAGTLLWLGSWLLSWPTISFYLKAMLRKR
jgi:hypothetical protein